MSLYAWQVFQHGEWNIIGSVLPGLSGVFPLVTTRIQLAESMGKLAEKHHEATGLPIRYARYDAPVILRELP